MISPRKTSVHLFQHTAAIMRRCVFLNFVILPPHHENLRWDFTYRATSHGSGLVRVTPLLTYHSKHASVCVPQFRNPSATPREPQVGFHVSGHFSRVGSCQGDSSFNIPQQACVGVCSSIL